MHQSASRSVGESGSDSPDIVAKLRNGDRHILWRHDAVRLQAANEIERLRNALGHVAYSPFGPPDSTDKQVLDQITAFAREQFRDRAPRPAPAPLVSLGQGEYAHDLHGRPTDIGAACRKIAGPLPDPRDEQIAKLKEACELAVHHLKMQNETLGQKRTLDVLDAALAGGAA